MASVSKDKNGRQRILFLDNGEPGQVWLGEVSDSAAADMKSKIEGLLTAKMLNRSPDPSLARWLKGLKPKMAAKLVRVGLIDPPELPPSATLAPFLTGYFEKRTDVKPATSTNWRHTQRCLLAYFGPDRALASITAGDAADWERWLLTKEARKQRKAKTGADAKTETDKVLARNTARKRVSNAKQFFDDAVSRDLIRKNPFEALSGAVGSNRSRDYFVTPAEATAVLGACPDAQWRLIFALSRYGGLRCPSEHLALRWEDINWAIGRMIVRSPKTEHHEGGESRVVPIFPELRPYLEDARSLAPRDAEHVISIRRDMGTNLRTRMLKIIKRAGLKPWPKLFQNLRSTRETELCEQFPIHVVCKWIGNSPKVADKHYLQVTDDHYQQASAQPSAQYATVTANEGQNVERSAPRYFEEHGPLRNCTAKPVGDEGLETPPDFTGKTSSGRKCAQPGAQSFPDPDLEQLLELWPDLSASTRRAIVNTALAGAAGGQVNQVGYDLLPKEEF